MFLESFFQLAAQSNPRPKNRIELPFGRGPRRHRLPGADVAQVVAAILADPIPHLGRIYETHWTAIAGHGRPSLAKFSEALNREITYSDISPGRKWEQGLKLYGLPEHMMGHLLAMGEFASGGFAMTDGRDGVQRVTGPAADERPGICVGSTRMSSA